MANAHNQAAPGTLEAVRAFLNTWQLPDGTGEPCDELASLEAMHQFYVTWFSQSVKHPIVSGLIWSGPTDERGVFIVPELVYQLRAELRNCIEKKERLVLTEWMTRQPVNMKVAKDEAGKVTLLYEPAGQFPCHLCAVIQTFVIEAIARSTWTHLSLHPHSQRVLYAPN